MARKTLSFKNNSLSVESVIRGHHVYKETLNLYKGGKLMCNHDKREEEKISAVGTYKDSRLVDAVPIELSFLFCKFIKKRNNQIFAEVNGGRKPENCVVVPCIYHANENKHIERFPEEINKLKKGKAIHMNIKISEIGKRTLSKYTLLVQLVYIYVNMYNEETSFV